MVVRLELWLVFMENFHMFFSKQNYKVLVKINIYPHLRKQNSWC
jgi:hypothetical protein